MQEWSWKTKPKESKYNLLVCYCSIIYTPENLWHSIPVGLFENEYGAIHGSFCQRGYDLIDSNKRSFSFPLLLFFLLFPSLFTFNSPCLHLVMMQARVWATQVQTRTTCKNCCSTKWQVHLSASENGLAPQ